MPVRIKVLPERLANQIAAGEVVERPASVVKELVENALDAGASRVTVEVLAGGGKLVKVSDDGSGMGADDALLSFERHATSKIATVDDLSNIATLGFRGEAIPSIASVSRVRLTTSTGDGPGTLVVVEGGRVVNVKQVGAPRGTVVEVSDLFFNTPARLKFLKSNETEFSHIAAAVEKVALAHPEVHVRLTNNGRESLDCPRVNGIRERVAQVYGRDYLARLAEVDFASGPYGVTGFVSLPGQSFADRGRQELYINGRPVKSPAVIKALYDAYRSVLMKGRHPGCILFLSLDPQDVDVNVHPAKREVRFSDNSAVHRVVFDAVVDALGRADALDGSVGFEPWGGGRGGGFQTWPDAPGAREERIREAAESYVSNAESRPDRQFMPQREPVQRSMKLPGQPAPHVPAQEHQPHVEPHHRGVLPVQVADSYIIIPVEDGYMVVDQHAAHERIQYEKVKAAHGKTGPGSQGLLVPERLDLSAKEAALMDAILPELVSMGLEVEHFGGTSYLIRNKPLFMDKVDAREAVAGMLAEMDETDARAGVEELREKVYQLMACKSAVKAGQRLHPEAMGRLVRMLFACEMPYACAHGRPTVVKFGLAELERMFKRK